MKINNLVILKHNILIFFILLILQACEEKVELDNFDKKLWKEDLRGCNGQRKGQLDTIREQKEKLKGLSQNQIIHIFGKPDFIELYKRNQRFYIYYYQKGHQCITNDKKLKLDFENDKIVKIRFSGSDSVTETVINE